MSALRLLRSPYRPEEIQGDRAAIARFLHDYLCEGTVRAVPVLSHGPKIRLDRGREPLGQSAWKWSEVWGKYVGCSYWSLAAVGAFEEVALHHPTRSPSAIARLACKRARGSQQLQHEHVFPRKAWRALMNRHVGLWQENQLDELVALLDRYCVGCIVTAREHRELTDRPDCDNPWTRYVGSSIQLAPNPAWPEPHKSWIQEAGLVDELHDAA